MRDVKDCKILSLRDAFPRGKVLASNPVISLWSGPSEDRRYGTEWQVPLAGFSGATLHISDRSKPTVAHRALRSACAPSERTRRPRCIVEQRSFVPCEGAWLTAPRNHARAVGLPAGVEARR